MADLCDRLLQALPPFLSVCADPRWPLTPPTFQLQTSYKVREKLEDVNTIDQLVELLDKAQNVLVLTGAGIR